MKIRMLAPLAAAILFGSKVAWAVGDGFSPPTIDAGLPWPSIGIAVGALAGVALLAFKKSTRTHLD